MKSSDEKQKRKSESTDFENSKIKRSGGARPGAGRKPFTPNDDERRQVEAMAGFGVPVKEIAALVRGGIDYDTLMKYFSEEMERGRAKANAQIGKGLFQKALGGDTTAMIFWAKTRMGWREKDEAQAQSAKIDLSLYLPDNGRGNT